MELATTGSATGMLDPPWGSLESRERGVLKSRLLLACALLLRALADGFVDVAPSAGNTLPVRFVDKAERRMAEPDDGDAVFFSQPVLDVIRHRVRHEQRPRELQQRGPLDGLNVRPKVDVVAAQVAIPA